MVNWNIESLTGYKPQTTFYTDFSIADKHGIEAIKDTYHRAFQEWNSNYIFMTELVMVLNWKSFEHQNNGELCHVYCDLYEELDNWCFDNFEEHELQYFIKTTDQEN